MAKYVCSICGSDDVEITAKRLIPANKKIGAKEWRKMFKSIQIDSEDGWCNNCQDGRVSLNKVEKI